MNAGFLKRAVILLIFLLVPQISLANAADFVIGLTDLSVTPSTVYSGNSIIVKASYSVSASITTRVRLELLFDGSVVDSSTQYRLTGDYDGTFNYTPSSVSAGSHDIGVRIRIYDGDVLKDEDVLTKSIIMNPAGNNHAIDITSITTPGTVTQSERFPVTITVKNNGNSEEDSIVFSSSINSIVYFGNSFSLISGTSSTQTMYVPAPSSTGTYDLTVSAYNTYVSTTERTTVNVQGTSISLTLSKLSAAVGEWVEIHGYATRGNYASEGAVSMYLDGSASGSILTRGNGYYSTQVKFDTPGTHKITVGGGGLTTSQNIYINNINTPQPLPASYQAPAQQELTIPGGNYTAIVVVTGEKQYVVYPETAKLPVSQTADVSKTSEVKYTNFSFVNIDTGTSELDAVQNNGNLLKITVTNHLGRSEMFSVSTDFNQKWSYVPGAEVILDGGKKVFEMYFTPDQSGTFSGSVSVIQKNTVIKTIPISLYVSPRKETPINGSIPLLSQLSATRIAALAAIIILTVIVLRFGARKTEAIEPKMTVEPSDDVSEILKAMKRPLDSPETENKQNVFYSQRDKIII